MDELSWETVDSAVDYTCPGFDVRRDDVELPDGTETDYHYVDEPEAVVVLPFVAGTRDEFDDEGRGGREVVVIDEWRQAVGRVSRGLPAGSVEDGDEDLVAAAARELREETGYEAESFEHLTTVEPTNGIANSVHHHFVAYDCAPTAEQSLDHNESIRVEQAPYERLLADVVNDRIDDGRTVVSVLQHELSFERR